MLLCFFFLVCPSSLAILSKDYKVNSLHDNKLFNESLVLDTPSRSVLYCASMCGPNCRYYGFNFETKKCRVHTCSTLVDAVEEEGWRYYSSNDSDCKRKLILYDSLEVQQPGHNILLSSSYSSLRMIHD